MSTAQAPALTRHTPARQLQVKIYSHSPLFYWWPVWVTGFILAALTYAQGERWTFADATVVIHPSKSLGVIFTVVALLVLLMTHTTVRGLASLTVIIAVLAVTVFFAYMGWWDDVFVAFQSLALYVNLGFYIFFSTGVFLIWALAFFVFDRFTYWTFRPGQVVYHQAMGGGEQTFDSNGMTVFKLRDDLFRHWILGMGSGDLHITTSGAKQEQFVVHNIMFVGRKLHEIQQLVAMKPDETPLTEVTLGRPG